MNGPTPTLDKVQSPEDIRKMSLPQLKDLCNDTRRVGGRGCNRSRDRYYQSLTRVDISLGGKQLRHWSRKYTSYNLRGILRHFTLKR